MLGQSLRASDMYLKELKAYKAPAVKQNDSVGHVQNFAMPKPPQSPEETDIANDLQSYEAQVPEIEGQGVAGETLPQEQDWFEDPDEEPAVPAGGATH
ncbi:ATP synthase F0 subcomplex subunit H atp14 [Recurvomyces mirabilis]|nr:ATP synthase F0 subcomplex subunit H atp14 [Recurvomyces mirabilis]